MPVQTGDDPEASTTPDGRLAEALGPSVRTALKHSVRDEPRLWTEAIFPILLPAVRMAVTSALREMVETLNHILERSLSLRSWRWRLEAWRTGRPFSEIVLLRSLVYRVEQVLLVHRHTGLLLKAISIPSIESKDADLISAMLTAIQDFIRDSFEVETSAGLRELHLGDFSLWVEQGPQAVLAAAVRGNAPAELRETFRAAVDLVHQEFGTELHNFRGDSKPLEQRCRAILEGCLQFRYQADEKRSHTPFYVCTALAVSLLLVEAGIYIRHAWQWSRALAALRDTPGLIVTQTGYRGGRRIEGLRDPLAIAPERVLGDHQIDPRQVSLRFRPYLSLDPEVLVKRVRMALQAPDSVSISLESGVVHLNGSASHAWLLRVAGAHDQLAMAGIREIRMDRLEDRDLRSLRIEIEGTDILFPLNSSLISPVQAGLCKALAEKAIRWIHGVEALGKTPRLDVVGYTDRSGTEERNRGLSQERADHVAGLLDAAGVQRKLLAVSGKATDAMRNTEAADAARRRAVLLRLYGDPIQAAQRDTR